MRRLELSRSDPTCLRTADDLWRIISVSLLCVRPESNIGALFSICSRSGVLLGLASGSRQVVIEVGVCCWSFKRLVTFNQASDFVDGLSRLGTLSLLVLHPSCFWLVLRDPASLVFCPYRSIVALPGFCCHLMVVVSLWSSISFGLCFALWIG